MDIQTYQRLSTRTMPTNLSQAETIAMLGLGIAGEAGEVVEIVKKDIFHGHMRDKKETEKEIGDLMFYIVNLATLYDLSMENILELNIEKLKIRYPNGFSTEDSIRRADVK
jgi:NTP pyrophosphatase (non-canonical NTP hydrolase)